MRKQAGMTQDVEQSWLRLHDGLRTFVARRVASAAEADDILQEVFLRLYRRLDALKDPRRFTSWVFQITRRAIVDHYRRPERQREAPSGLASDVEMKAASPVVSQPDGRTEDVEVARDDMARCLGPFLDRLPAEYRQALKLVEMHGMTHTAAARQLGLSVSGMKSRVQRGRRQLRRMLEDCCSIQLDARRRVTDYTPRSRDQCGCSS